MHLVTVDTPRTINEYILSYTLSKIIMRSRYGQQIFFDMMTVGVLVLIDFGGAPKGLKDKKIVG